MVEMGVLVKVGVRLWLTWVYANGGGCGECSSGGGSVGSGNGSSVWDGGSLSLLLLYNIEYNNMPYC